LGCADYKYESLAFSITIHARTFVLVWDEVAFSQQANLSAND
jgi:hypothetical protein